MGTARKEVIDIWDTCVGNEHADFEAPELKLFAGTTTSIRQVEAGRSPSVHAPLHIIAMTANALEGDREACLAVDIGIQLALVIQRLYPEQFKTEAMSRLLGDEETLRAAERLLDMIFDWECDMMSRDKLSRGNLPQL